MTDLPWHFVDLSVPALQARSRGAGVRVAVLDSGVADAGGNFGSLRTFASDGSSADALDETGHGTACASLIASRSEGAPGIAPDVDLISIRVTTGGLPHEGVVREAVSTAARLKCDVISCSLVLPDAGAPLLDTIREVCNGGTVIVAASGNDPSVVSAFPERTPNVLVVGPYDRNRTLVQSRFGLFTDVLAPGVDLSVLTPDGSTALFGQSSGAAAVASGIIALVLAATGRRNGVALEGLAKASAMSAPGGVRLLDPDRLLHAAQQLP